MTEPLDPDGEFRVRYTPSPERVGQFVGYLEKEGLGGRTRAVPTYETDKTVTSYQGTLELCEALLRRNAGGRGTRTIERRQPDGTWVELSERLEVGDEVSFANLYLVRLGDVIERELDGSRFRLEGTVPLGGYWTYVHEEQEMRGSWSEIEHLGPFVLVERGED
jgi:hypothetical protein